MLVSVSSVVFLLFLLPPPTVSMAICEGAGSEDEAPPTEI